MPFIFVYNSVSFHCFRYNCPERCPLRYCRIVSRSPLTAKAKEFKEEYSLVKWGWSTFWANIGLLFGWISAPWRHDEYFVRNFVNSSFKALTE